MLKELESVEVMTYAIDQLTIEGLLSEESQRWINVLCFTTAGSIMPIQLMITGEYQNFLQESVYDGNIDEKEVELIFSTNTEIRELVDGVNLS